MKRILGLDLGTNSIGWAVVKTETLNDSDHTIGIDGAGSRIIPMDAKDLGDFDKGNTVSHTKDRTKARGMRRLSERRKQRRERLNRVLDIMGFLPQHYSAKLDRYGHFIETSEPKLAWRKDESGRYEFLFKVSFNEMLADFRQHNPDFIAANRSIPYDWTIYYLRRKALTQQISKEELAWILLQFNQKRGYHQLRDNEADTDTKENEQVEYQFLTVKSVEQAPDNKKGETWYLIRFEENDWVYRRKSNIPLDEWVGKVKEFIITTKLNVDGTPETDKDDKVKRSLRAPKDDDWALLKVKTEHDIEASEKTVGAYIYDSLLQNPMQKINGKLIQHIERTFYRRELEQILTKQSEFHPELSDRNLYQTCINVLYPSNEAHKRNIANRSFTYLFIDDILLYQRPLKSKKSLIADCPYETTVYIDHITGEQRKAPVKCIAKSHPLYQEFRLWQFIYNLKIYRREYNSNGKHCHDFDVTDRYLNHSNNNSNLFYKNNSYTKLFRMLNDRKEIDQKALLKHFGLNDKEYRWNYVEDKDKKYPCNETRALMLSYFKKAGIDKPDLFLDRETENALWIILYSVSDKQELIKALHKFAQKHGLDDTFVSTFAKIPPFTKDYGAYSAKAIKKLLPLMRIGEYWSADAIDANTGSRIDKIITGEYDESIRNRVREKALTLNKIEAFQGLPLWLACYVVYDRHSEVKESGKWQSPDDIDSYLNSFRHHSLNNPIVEQVVMETLRTVRDIWKQYGKPDEIHVELGREMKRTAAERKSKSEEISRNETTNMRIKNLLQEFYNPEYGIEGVRPYSPSQQELLRIYEDGALSTLQKEDHDFDFISKISKTPQPSRSDVLRYKCWLEQNYRSPYTGQNIPLSRLFTSDYQIEHVIPQSLFFDDSYSNKVICESAVNLKKDRMLGYEFIKAHHGEKIDLGNGRTAEIFSIEAYEQFVRQTYANNSGKMKKLLLEEIPDDFNQRQLNDSRYISRLIMGLLSNIVREDDEQEATSKNVIPCTGFITDRLKKDWGLNDVWNAVILPRFERLNKESGTNDYTTLNNEGHTIPNVPLAMQQGFNKKRIDHRHHAMDAIVIACATRNMVNYLNNQSAGGNREDLKRLLCEKHRTDDNGNYQWLIRKPWDTFTQDTHNALNQIVVSFKQNLRVITKTSNHYQHYENGKKVFTKQTKGDSLAIRKQMHKETVSGLVNLRRQKPVPLAKAIENTKAIVNKELKAKLNELLAQGKNLKAIKQYFETEKDAWQEVDIKNIYVYYFTNDTNIRCYANRKPISTSITPKQIDSITDTSIANILKKHLEENGNNPEMAFSPDGIDRMNRDIKRLNNGKDHKPVYKVRIYEEANKFKVSQTGSKSAKYVEAAKGTNLFFAIYEQDAIDSKTGDTATVRKFVTIPLNMVIECQKQYGVADWKSHIDELIKSNEMMDSDCKLRYIISPNDLVYLPTKEDLQTKTIVQPLDKSRIYKMISSSKSDCFFINHNIANYIDKNYNKKTEHAITGEMIKKTCIPLKVDRLGNITFVL